MEIAALRTETLADGAEQGVGVGWPEPPLPPHAAPIVSTIDRATNVTLELIACRPQAGPKVAVRSCGRQQKWRLRRPPPRACSRPNPSSSPTSTPPSPPHPL